MINYHKDLLIYLGDGKELAFPSIGSVMLVQPSTSPSPHTDVFLDFSAYSLANYPDQLKYFSDLWGRSQLEVNRFFLNVSIEILALSQKKKSFILDGVGSFKAVNDRIVFSTSGELEQTLQNYHEVDSQSYVSKQIRTRSVSPPTINNENETAQKVNKVEKGDAAMFISRPLHHKKVAAVLLFFIVAFSGIFLVNNYTNSTWFPASYQLEDSGYSADEINKSPIVSDIPTDAIIVTEDEENEEQEPADQAKVDTKVNEEREPAANVDAIHRDQADFVQDQVKECTYILGSFTNSRNVTKLVSKLENLGIKPYTEVTGKLTRVGGTIPCDADVISQLRILSPDMWLL